MYRARWGVLVTWLIVLLVSIPFAQQVGSALKGGGFSNGVTESDRANSLLTGDLGFHSSLTVIFASARWRASDARFRASVAAALVPAGVLPHIVSIDTYYRHSPRLQGQRLVSLDGHAALAILAYDSSLENVETLVSQVRAAITSSTLQVIVAGDAAVPGDLQAMSRLDLQKAETIAIPLTLILLLLVFGTVVAACAPLVIGVCSLIPTFAVIYAIGRTVDLSVFCLNVTSMIGFGIGIDYALFIVCRFREEVRRNSVEDAIAIAIGTAGRAVLFSGVTVMIGLSGLFVFQANALRSIALGGSLVVLASVVAALTLLPALLGVLGTRIEAMQVVPWQQSSDSAFWIGLATWVTQHPWRVMVTVLATLAVIASPITALRLHVPDATILPASAESRLGFDVLNRQFLQNQTSPILIVVHAEHDLLSAVSMGALYDYVHAVDRDPGVDALRTLSLVTAVPSATRGQVQQVRQYLSNRQIAALVKELVGNNSTVVSLQPRPGQTSSQLDNLVRRIRAVAIGAGLKHYVGGMQAGMMDPLASVYTEFPLCIVFVVAVTYAVLLVFLRSAILPLKAIFMNSLSLIGAYGAVVWIIQQGHLSWMFDFSPTGYVDDITPIILFCTLFGLSMDYEVLLLSRIREQYVLTGDNTASIVRGLEHTGRIITSAALILIAVAGSFSLAGVVLIKAIGLGLAIAILLDATLLRCLLVPATMRVLGQWNWWLPGRPHAGHTAEDVPREGT